MAWTAPSPEPSILVCSRLFAFKVLHGPFPLCRVFISFIWLTPILPPGLSQTQQALLEAVCPSIAEALGVSALLKSLCWNEGQCPITRLGVGVEMGATGKNAPDYASPLDLNRMYHGTEAERRKLLLPSRQVGESGVGTPRTGVL